MKKIRLIALLLLFALAMCSCSTATEPQSTPDNSDVPEESAEPAGQTEVLEGVGKGNNGDIKVKVTTVDGVITAVEVVEHAETAGICDTAIEQVPQEIVAANSADVDAVAGATNTSNGIMEAVRNALNAGDEEQGDETTEATGDEPYVGYQKMQELAEKMLQFLRTTSLK